MFKRIGIWLIGKKICTETGEMDAVSKAKITAVIWAILTTIEPVSTAFGHPVHVPDSVYKVLAAAGLWTIRDALPPK